MIYFKGLVDRTYLERRRGAW